MIDETLLDNIIIGRVEPRIYAFTTNTIPNYLKVGDTYRPVSTRLNEWRAHFPELEKQFEGTARISDDVYFRDYAVHQFLESDKHRVRLMPADIPAGVYYSNEFFKEASVEDVQDAVEDIAQDYSDNTGKYQFYNAENRLAETFTFARTETYDPRPNQIKTIQAFKAARDNGRKNLLMYAVMRFGKSFTSMCCAVEMSAKLVVIVSAKADVKLEWKKTVESHVKFADYDFVSSDELSHNNHIITEKLSQNRKIAVFLTLQDLQGDIIKDKHQEIFGQTIDLLLVDETHFGARAEKYGAVLKASGYEKDIKNKKDEDDFVDVEDADEVVKTLSADTTIHLSGTPYRILMGSEFKKEDIIAFYQFTDIVHDQEAWDKEHVLDDNYREWDNPYYGFPQMVRFAFNPNKSSRKRLEELRQEGITYAFSALFKPKSIKKDANGLHKQFKYEQEILDLLEVIDGSKTEDGLLGFLDYDKIKDGKMCRHIVIVLPYCASCDALEALIQANKEKFRNLNGYKIINISGVDNLNAYKTPNAIKAAVREAEANGQKTITLTVNRMLTGSTVPEWDTMLYLKDTASPQEYDQAIFRLQNQYIKKYVDDNGDTIKYNMKPQTLLVDFMPNRMFVMQEAKSKIYNANVDTGGNSELERRIFEELRISPIVTINADKIVEVKATDILKVVSNYQKDKGIKDEALETPVDLSILDDETIRAVIEQENEIGSKSGLSTPAHEDKDGGEGGDMDTPAPDGGTTDPDDGNTDDPHPDDSGSTTADDQRSNESSLKKKIQSYYVRILLFAYITKDRVISVSDIIEKFESEDNRRIAKNLGLSKDILVLLNQKSNKFVLSDLDYKIQDLNDLSQATDMEPEARANVAVKKFGKLGDAIVITPSNICDDMVNLFPDDFMKEIADKKGRILDIAGTSGEYALALQKRLLSLGIDRRVVADMIYTIPKSSICYELTRKLYEMLGLNVANIATEFVASDLLGIKTDDEIDYDKIVKILTQNKPFNEIKLTDDPQQGGTDMIQFDAVVGNPPYQEQSIGDNKGFTPPIYDKYLDLACLLSNHAVMIHPARFLFNAGSTPKEWNKKMLESNHIRLITYESEATKMFPGTAITGGIAITEFDKTKHFSPIGIFVSYKELNMIRQKVVNMQGFMSLSSIISGRTPYLFTDIFHTENPNVINLLSEGHMYDVSSNAFASLKNVFLRDVPNDEDDYCRVLGRLNSNRIYCWIKKAYVRGRRPEYINKWKVFLPKANGASGMLGDEPARMISKPVIGKPFDIATDTFICVGAFNDETSANALYKYMNGKFARVLLGILKVTQDNTADKWKYVPLQDFSNNSDIDWSKTIHEIDKQLYAKYNLDESEIAFIESMIKPME